MNISNTPAPQKNKNKMFLQFSLTSYFSPGCLDFTGSGSPPQSELFKLYNLSEKCCILLT